LGKPVNAVVARPADCNEIVVKIFATDDLRTDMVKGERPDLAAQSTPPTLTRDDGCFPLTPARRSASAFGCLLHR